MMNRTLKQAVTIPPASSLRTQQGKFDHFREEFNQVRPHEALGMKKPAEVHTFSQSDAASNKTLRISWAFPSPARQPVWNDSSVQKAGFRKQHVA